MIYKTYLKDAMMGNQDITMEKGEATLDGYVTDDDL